MGPSKELPEYLKLNIVAISQDYTCQPDDKSGTHQISLLSKDEKRTSFRSPKGIDEPKLSLI